MPEYPLTEAYPTGPEKYFTVVWWDQRGAGLSYSANTSPSTMNTEQFIVDTITVTNYLRDRFHQAKIYLMGHSWGSYIAIQAAAKSPDLYHAYIGVGQISEQMESERKAYQYLLDYYTKTGDSNAVTRQLPDAYLKIRDGLMHEAGIGTTHRIWIPLSPESLCP